MGQKVNPIGLRLGINRTWDIALVRRQGRVRPSCCTRTSAIREALMKQLKQAAVSKIVIERPHKKCRVTIHSARPGVVIGKKGADIEKLRKLVGKMTNADVAINIVEVRKPEVDATLVAESIAQQLERRVAFRRAMKRAVQSAMRLGAEGIRINCSGRLGGAEIARHGMVPRGPRSAAHAARRRRLRHRDGVHDLRHLRHQGLDLQGRDPRARSDGAGQAPDRRRRPRRAAAASASATA